MRANVFLKMNFFLKTHDYQFSFVWQIQNSQTVLYFNYIIHHYIFILDLRVQLKLLEMYWGLFILNHHLLTSYHMLYGNLLWRMRKALMLGKLTQSLFPSSWEIKYWAYVYTINLMELKCFQSTFKHRYTNFK